MRGYAPYRTSADTRSGYVAVKRMDSAPPSERAEHGRSLRASSVHHGAQIIHPFLECRHGDPIRQAGATFVEHDQTTERRETLVVSALGRILPLQLKVRDEHRNVNEVEGSVTDDLVRDVHVARLRVPGLGNFEHCVSLGRCLGDDRQI
jgi:hypothetical protein